MDHVLGRVGAELAGAAAALKSLQDDLAPVLTEARAVGPALVVRLQSLDAVEQTLRDLSRFVGDLAAGAPPIDRDRIDRLLDGLTLGGLADRLRAGGSTAAAGAEARAGDMELF